MSDFEELDSGVKGKQGELRIIGKLLEKGFLVYSPMVDTGYDCIIDAGNGDYKEIQIKTRTKNPLFQVKDTKPHDNFYVICHLMLSNDTWIIPSKIYFEKGKATKVKGRREKILYRLTIGKEFSESYAALHSYHENWGLLKGNRLLTKNVGGKHEKVEGDHFGEPDLEDEIVNILANSTKPMATIEIINAVKTDLSEFFKKADLEPMSEGRPRWEATARFVIYTGLKKKGYIESKGKNQYVLTELGRQHFFPKKD